MMERGWAGGRGGGIQEVRREGDRIWGMRKRSKLMRVFNDDEMVKMLLIMVTGECGCSCSSFSFSVSVSLFSTSSVFFFSLFHFSKCAHVFVWPYSIYLDYVRFCSCLCVPVFLRETSYYTWHISFLIVGLCAVHLHYLWLEVCEVEIGRWWRSWCVCTSLYFFMYFCMYVRMYLSKHLRMYVCK